MGYLFPSYNRIYVVIHLEWRLPILNFDLFNNKYSAENEMMLYPRVSEDLFHTLPSFQSTIDCFVSCPG